MTERSNKKPDRTELNAELEMLRRREFLFDEAESFIHQGYFEWNVECKRFQSWSPDFARILSLPADSEHDPIHLRQLCWMLLFMLKISIVSIE